MTTILAMLTSGKPLIITNTTEAALRGAINDSNKPGMPVLIDYVEQTFGAITVNVRLIMFYKVLVP